MAQILGQKSLFGGLCNCVRQKWGHANTGTYTFNIEEDLVVENVHSFFSQQNLGLSAFLFHMKEH